MEKNFIHLHKVCVHNLKSISLKIPKNHLVVLTGVSGSGKSSLAFDTIYVEGQRRYVESLSTFAKRYLGDLAKPDVEKVEGLSPTISIEQKTAGRNPRSTVGTMTEIYDYLRVLYARIGVPHCPVSGEAVAPQSRERIIKTIQNLPEGMNILLLAPYARGKKAEFLEDFTNLLRKGFTRARVDGRLVQLEEPISLDRNVAHDIDIVIDKLTVSKTNLSRIAEDVTSALDLGNGICILLDQKTEEETLYSMHAFSQASGLSYHSLEPHDFSFNSPHGMCPHCNGLGDVIEFDLNKVIDPEKSIAQDCCQIASPYDTVRYGNIYNNLSRIYHFDINTPWRKLSEKAKQVFLYGTGEKWTRMEFTHPETGHTWTDYVAWKGVLYEARQRYQAAKSASYQKKMQQLMTQQLCPSCHGSRLKPYPSVTTLNGETLQKLTSRTIDECHQFFTNLPLNDQEKLIAAELLKEIIQRLQFLLDVGLHYLTLSRTAPTLSGGEAQRVRLASQIGCGLVGITYILDEPSIGLHPRDNTRLIQTLKHLKNMGNTVLVVEHDEETILAADQVIDFGPGPGVLGGEIVVQGGLKELISEPRSLTGAYLSGKAKIPIPKKRRKKTSAALTIEGACHHNLKNVTAAIPLGLFVAITGVSGSGKSSLISDILHPVLSNLLHKGEHPVGQHKALLGTELIDKVIAIDQSPIGRNPRSNPATYIKVFDEIRDLFSQLPESMARGYKPGRFSFNVKEGSCPQCEGMGMVKVDMDFMEDAWVSCSLCKGKRFDHETLSVLFKEKTICDILEMTVQEASDFFQTIPSIASKLEVLKKVGMSYIQLGQPSTTLSGGEAQRIKLAKELSRPSTGKTLYILDEPTTGLHFHDINHLLAVLHELVNRGNSVIVIEHNMDVVKTADWLIDLGPEGGAYGGEIVAQGTPEAIASLNSPTGKALKQALDFSGIDIKALSEVKPQTDTAIRSISVIDAEQHNLKRVSVEIPREAITILTGPSGSGKSSLAFDTIYAEGQRRYIESLSPYARQFVSQMPKPKVGQVEGLSPAVAIEQKAHSGNPRSTVGTLTEIYDYLRVLFARMGTPHCPETGEEIRAISKEHVLLRLLDLPEGEPIHVLAPLELAKQDSFEELIARFKRKGFLRIRLNGQVYEMDDSIPFDRRRKNELFLIIDRLKVSSSAKSRLYEAIEHAAEISSGKLVVLRHPGKEEEESISFNLSFSVPSTGKSYPEITPHTFAFNTPEGMCLDCEGLGFQYGANLIAHSKLDYLPVEALLQVVWNLPNNRSARRMLQFASDFLQEEGISLDDQISKLSAAQMHFLMNGSSPEKWYEHPDGFRYKWLGINPTLAKAGRNAHRALKEALLPYLEEIECFSCKGERVNPLARHVLISGKSIGKLCNIPSGGLLKFLKSLKPSKENASLLSEVFKQLLQRLTFLCEIGLQYISLHRTAPSLSNGEAQRIRLARQLGSGLTGVLYVLDEPTIGLHPRDNQLLNNALKKLKELGNTLILVEHDPQTMAMADYILDMGPQAGILGGHITAQGTLKQLKKNPNSLTGAYLSGRKTVPLPVKKRAIGENYLSVRSASIHNLKKIDLSFPVGALTCLTGVSGSGKSTLMHQVILPAVTQGLYRSDSISFGYAAVDGISQFDKVISINQDPIGLTSRSDVSTYVDLLTPIRDFFASLPLARTKGLQPKHFSYNHKRGMCTHCQGLGYLKVEMHFLPPVTISCPECHGNRLNPISLEVLYQGKNLGQILQMTVEECRIMFENHRKVVRILDTLISVGLGYLCLGQEIATLSGGEAQRIKLSRELSKRSTGKTLYLLDEPTTGLHQDDICKLLPVLHRLVDKGNTMIIIEHNLDIIKNADFIIDLGPEAGEEGGYIICSGTPEEVASHPKSYTGKYLKSVISI